MGRGGKDGHQGGMGCGRAGWGGTSCVVGADGKGRGTAERERHGYLVRDGEKQNGTEQDRTGRSGTRQVG